MGVTTHFRVNSLFSMRTESLPALQSCRSVDAFCKWTLTLAISNTIAIFLLSE